MEVEAIVDQVIACIADSLYNGLTFGVISLLGQAQVKVIEKKLLDLVSPAEREFRCGDAADFQGSERDIMFLSMVAAPEPGKRSVALTQDLYMMCPVGHTGFFGGPGRCLVAKIAGWISW